MVCFQALSPASLTDHLPNHYSISIPDILVNCDIAAICLGEQSFKHADVLSEKINFSAPGGPKSAKFDPGHLDPIYFEVGNFSASPDPPYISKNAQMC